MIHCWAVNRTNQIELTSSMDLDAYGGPTTHDADSGEVGFGFRRSLGMCRVDGLTVGLCCFPVPANVDGSEGGRKS